MFEKLHIGGVVNIIVDEIQIIGQHMYHNIDEDSLELAMKLDDVDAQ
jgi:hypothetical protein